ncbi:MAG: tryptophan synthase subunit alpha [Flavisolibacter sp.]|nr:tryptophan synthase subunit alpha [Flavisolibacter sp.]
MNFSNTNSFPDLSSPIGGQGAGNLTPGPSPSGEWSVASKNTSILHNENLHKNATPILYQYARELRQVSTKTEQLLWKQLRNNKLDGFKFRRQHPIDHYVADFYCHQKALVVELDGSVHDTLEAKDYDSARDKHFADLGINVLRFTNNEVEQNITAVLQKIKSMLKQQTTHLPSPSGEGPGVRSMTRIQNLFQQKTQRILNLYCTAGFPQLNSTLPVMQAFQKNGADIIELGMPYSDPLADGPIIQASNTKALHNGMTITTLFNQLKDFRNVIHVPVVLMGYLNPLLQYGFEAFCARAAEVGIDGLIIPDIPMYEYETEYKAVVEKYGLDFIFLVTPETSEERIRKLDSLSTGFLYAVSSSSTTGSDKDFTAVELYLQRLKNMQLQNPILVGFGIKDKQTFESACRYANGAIIASAYIKAIEGAENVEEKTERFLEGILK